MPNDLPGQPVVHIDFARALQDIGNLTARMTRLEQDNNALSARIANAEKATVELSGSAAIKKSHFKFWSWAVTIAVSAIAGALAGRYLG